MTKRRGAALIVGIVALLAAAAIWIGNVPLSSEQLRRRIVTSLSRSFESKVDLGSIEWGLYPRLRIVGHDLVIRHRKREDVPLIAVRQFTVSSSIRTLVNGHVEDVVLEGLAIQLPPIDRQGNGDDARAASTSAAPEEQGARWARQVIIDQLTADDSSLTLLRRDPTRPPRVWQMHTLRLQSVGAARAMPFQSVLTNAIPPGEIDTTGTFGPWNVEEPAHTPITGTFVFDKADLSVFKGLRGMLSARGSYKGPLERLAVSGHTTTPDFAITIGNHPIALEADYQAVVDATNGNTALERVEATMQKTSLVAVGGVYEVPEQKGRRVSLTITMDSGRLEDILPLAIDTPKPTMTGGLAMTSTLELPPGDRDVVDKLRLQGRFRVAGGRFTDPVVQDKVDALSGRARTDDEKAVKVASNFVGDFNLGDGRLDLRPVQFDIPGALVHVIGRYGLRQGSLAFAGHVEMDASMSQAIGGWKGFLLKPVNPLFRRNGRTFVPITITGLRSNPKFGLDRGRVFSKDKAPAVPRPR